MTLWLVLSWSVARTIVIATLSVWISRGLLRQIEQTASASVRRMWLLSVMVPLIMPELVIGFTYRLTAQQLTDSVWGTELLYAVLVLVRSCAVCSLVRLLLSRSVVTQESIHSWRLLHRSNSTAQWNHLKLLVTGPWRSALVAWCLTALVAFQDFETAALVQVDRHPVVWTVWLFDANAGNQHLNHSLKLILAPVLFELLLLIPGLLLIGRGDHRAMMAPTLILRPGEVRSRPLKTWIAFLVTLAGGVLMIGWPVIVSVPELVSGFTVVSGDVQGILQQESTTFGFSVVAAMLAMSTAVLLRRGNNAVLTCACLAPGLAGSLALSLTLLWMFQLPGIRWFWDTWLPLLIGQSLFLLPRAWVLLFVLESVVSEESHKSAHLLLQGNRQHRLAAVRILWRLSHLKWLAAVTLLCHWCTWDVTTASILRPVTIEPMVTRLYREMHFSRTESLTALALITALVPIIVAALATLIWRWRMSQRVGS